MVKLQNLGLLYESPNEVLSDEHGSKLVRHKAMKHTGPQRYAICIHKSMYNYSLLDIHRYKMKDISVCCNYIYSITCIHKRKNVLHRSKREERPQR
jgi:hypothetical protein